MTSKELQQYLLREFPQENACCEWKEMKTSRTPLPVMKRMISSLMFLP